MLAVVGSVFAGTAIAGAQDGTEATTTTARGSGGIIDPNATSTTAAVDVAATTPVGAAGESGTSGASGASGADTTTVGAAGDATTTTAAGTVDTESTANGSDTTPASGGNDRVLNLIIIGLLVLAGLIAIATILFWRSTVPERIDTTDPSDDEGLEHDDEDGDLLDGEHHDDSDDGTTAAPVLAPPRVRVGAPVAAGASADAAGAMSADVSVAAVEIAGPTDAPAPGAFSVPPPTHLPPPPERPYAQRPTASAPEPSVDSAEPSGAGPGGGSGASRPDSATQPSDTPPAPGTWSVPAPDEASDDGTGAAASPAPLPVEKLAPPEPAAPVETSEPAEEPEPPKVVRRNRSRKRAAGPWGEGAKMGQLAEIPDPTLSPEGTEFSRGVRIVPAPGSEPTSPQGSNDDPDEHGDNA